MATPAKRASSYSHARDRKGAESSLSSGSDSDSDADGGANAATRAELQAALLDVIQPMQATHKNYTNLYDLDWPASPLAVQRAYELTIYLEARYGTRTPVNVNPDPDYGFVQWPQPPAAHGRRYHEWRINARGPLHDKPSDALHVDFFDLTIRARPKDAKKWLKAPRISDSIRVHRLQGTVTAGCHFRGAGVAALSLVVEYFHGQLTLREAADRYDSRVKLLAREQADVDKAFRERAPSAVWHPDTGKSLTPLTDAYEAYMLAQ